MLRTLFSNLFRKKPSSGTMLSALAVVCTLLALSAAHWLILQPAIAKLYVKPDCYEGTSYVTSGEYTTFEGGTDFAQVLQKSGVMKLGEVTEFFYFDNRALDNPFYGKQSDIFALSIKIQSNDRYKETKTALIKDGAGPVRTDTFAYYYVSVIEDPGVMLAFYDATRTVRVVYVTEVQPNDALLPIIEQNSPLFQYDNKKKD